MIGHYQLQNDIDNIFKELKCDCDKYCGLTDSTCNKIKQKIINLFEFMIDEHQKEIDELKEEETIESENPHYQKGFNDAIDEIESSIPDKF